ncbi:MAG TPA: esterase-like activity of phytase family protein [Chitinophagaceae bacterium]|nr:esterase-like activity of phytase family protein [Chitinophagaceae bacterium]
MSEYDLPNRKQFNGTTIGGLSGIDYDVKRDVYYLISDDRSIINPARFYTTKILLRADKTGNYLIDSIEFRAVDSLKTKERTIYANSKQDPSHTPDPESLRYDPVRDEIVWASEGERYVGRDNSVLEDPAITIIDRDGNYRDTFALPANMHVHKSENGPRQNSAFEGLTFTTDHKYLFVSTEEPIYEDGPRAGLNDSTAWIRIIKFDAQTKKPVAEYAYQIEPVAYPATPANAFKLNGVSEILDIGNNKLLVVERSFSTGSFACTIRVFVASLDEATNVEHVNSLMAQSMVQPASKKLLLNMDELGRYIDNVEGVTFGPNLSNGHRTLIFVVDDNFSALEKSQFLLFEVIP